ncbi:hypothetical protein SC10_B2orf02128 [Bacillus paralicheniformis]|nr:hypothetical protein SC10_B2orf02128 [Bacillus paralicheniformis]
MYKEYFTITLSISDCFLLNEDIQSMRGKNGKNQTQKRQELR